jgi:outer membrane protein OmpA-like peptidoglycan-associated protein
MTFLKGRAKSNTSILIVLSLVAAVAAGCGASARTKGAIIGAAGGAGVGAAAGGKKGAVIGGAAGAVVGGLIGHYMDEQEKKLQTVEGATVERDGENLKLTFDSAILFDTNKTDLKATSMDNLTKVASVLTEYPKTDLIIEGHTDSQGTETYNQDLSERRADSVKSFLIEKGVAPSRLQTRGYGEMSPIASNDSAEGRSQNRRVEVKIKPNEELREEAAAAEKKG